MKSVSKDEAIKTPDKSDPVMVHNLLDFRKNEADLPFLKSELRNMAQIFRRRPEEFKTQRVKISGARGVFDLREAAAVIAVTEIDAAINV